MKDQIQLRENIKKSAIRGLSWTVLTTLLGLVPLWVTMCVSYIRTDVSYSMWGALQEGALLFFIMAVTSVITMTYHFRGNLPISRWVRGVMFTLFPFLIGMLVIAVYVALYISDPSQVDRSALIVVYSVIIIFTFVYAVTAKSMIFFYEEAKR